MAKSYILIHITETSLAYCSGLCCNLKKPLNEDINVELLCCVEGCAVFLLYFAAYATVFFGQVAPGASELAFFVIFFGFSQLLQIKETKVNPQ